MYGVGYVMAQSPVLIGSPKPIPQPYKCPLCEVWGRALPPRCWNCGSADVATGYPPGGGAPGVLSPREEHATVDA